jgi:CRP/FNR family transcriptional regulator, cyclic AMP receptor protein
VARTPSMAMVLSASRKGSFWRRLDPEERAAFLKVGTRRPYRKGATLIRAGDETQWAAVLLTGRVQVISADGMRVIATRADGDIVGEHRILDGQPHAATVVAETRVWALIVDGPVLDGLFTRLPGILRVLCTVLSDQLREYEERLTAQTGSAFDKIVRHLVLSTDARGPVVHIGSQEALGKKTGVSRDSVIRVLRRLREAEIIYTERGIVIVRALEELRTYLAR